MVETTKRATVFNTAIFSKDGKHRYLLEKIWNKELPEALIVMIHPSYANELVSDTTTMLCVNQALSHGFGGICITNLFSQIQFENDKVVIDDSLYKVNSEYILKAASKCGSIIIATGRGNNKEIVKCKKRIIHDLEPYSDKLYSIADKDKKHMGYHPLSPKIRNNWSIEKYIEDTD